MSLFKKAVWFISHPSGGMQHTPDFFDAVKEFEKKHPEIEINYPHEKAEEVQLTRDAISLSDLVLVEASLPSTGSGIDLGWASAAKKKIVAFHQGGAQLSPAIKFVTKEIHVYVGKEQLAKILESLI